MVLLLCIVVIYIALILSIFKELESALKLSDTKATTPRALLL